MSGLLIAGIFILPALAGSAVLASWKLATDKVSLLLMGTAAGLAAFTTIMYLISWLIPLSPTSILATLLTFSAAAGAAALARTKPAQLWQWWLMLPTDTIALATLAVSFLLFSVLAPKLLIVQPDGWYTGIVNAYGDVAWHAANITTFAQSDTIVPDNPIFSGTRLTYPFLTNFFSAVLLVSGASLPQSITLPAWLLAPVLLTLFYYTAHALTNSRRAASLAWFLFLFGGATLGWLRIWPDWQASGQSLVEFLLHLPLRDYSGVGTDQDGFFWLNPVTSLLLPQRSFLFGMAIAFTLLILLLHRRRFGTPAYAAAGVMAGLLPLFHAHSVLALAPVIVALAVFDIVRHKASFTPWLTFTGAACLIGLPEIAYYVSGGQESGSFLRWHPGWLAEGSVIWFWLKNTGLVLPAAGFAIAWFWRQQRRELALTTACGVLIFVIANLYAFAPWLWDNFKLFVYALIFMLPAAALLAVTAWQRGGSVVKVVVLIVVAVHALSAALDVWKLTLPTAPSWREWDNEAITFAQDIQAETTPEAVIITAPIHNSPVALTGRSQYLGYAAHVWSHGGDPWQREAAIGQFYQGTLPLEQLPEDSVTHVVVGPSERSSYPALVINPAWRLVAEHGSYQLYTVK